ncbi:hypothetical protein HVA01_03770 [Halovibrio variabilis]|uniref:Type 4 fimbrial biogenesis protein PilX N-terminal domain-containing protein n=1 Tax=Halovibrio variabilis TaxID=31910 RepID=A0A511UL01_9GAMM|nr:hypothetical protein [Halovibrio variabilis]GEN26731.1 hypothetical protein HVA01_03770 [Halovibrio variabilis]
MKQQQGAALVIVMALLSGALMLGMSGMQSALIDERLAGNYRASTQAQMTSDSILAALASDSNQASRESYLAERLEMGGGKLQGVELAGVLRDRTLNDFINDLLPGNFAELEESEQDAIKRDLLTNLELTFEVNTQDKTVTITSRDRGLRNSALRDSSVVYRYNIEKTDGEGLLSEGVITCYGANLQGGGGVAIDSFDSRKGAYGVGKNSGGKASLIALHENSDLLFNMGSAPGVTGDIYSAGRIEVNNTMPIDGNVYAVGDVSLEGNSALITGSLYSENNVFFRVGTRVDGDVFANNSIQVLGNWGGVNALQPDGSIRADTSYAIGGGATSPNIYTEIGNRVEGEISNRNPDVDFESFLSEGLKIVRENEACPEYGLGQFYEDYQFSSNPKNVDAVSNNGPTSSDVLGESKNVNGFEVFHVNRLKIGGNGLVLEEPTIIIADSNVALELWGDANAITLRDGAALRIVSKGKVSLKGSNVFDMNGFDPVVDVGGRSIPAFSFISLYEGTGNAIDMASDGDMYGELLAPSGGVNITGSARLMGRVFSNILNLSGGGSIHYDRAYADVAIGTIASNAQWCSFADISPLTIVSPVGRLSLPSSRAEFNGSEKVPDITVATGDAEKFSSASTANGDIVEGIPGGLFDRGESAENFDNFIELLRNKADDTFNGVSGNNAVFGSIGDEKITFVNGDVDANNVSGAGVLVVNGNYNGGGNPAFNGLMIVLGNFTQKGGGGSDFNGGLLIAPYSRNEMEFSPANIEFSGGGSNDFNYNEQVLRTAFNLLNEDEKESWGSCGVPSDGLITWSLIDWQ